MTQLDLFTLKADDAPGALPLAGTPKKDAMVENNDNTPINNNNKAGESLPTVVILEKAETRQVDAYPVIFKNVEADAAAPQQAITPDMVFANDNIGVKIKPKQGTGGQAAKPQPRRSIITKQQPTEYSTALNQKLDSVKNGIKEALLKEAAQQEKKQQRTPQKRGRKSYRDMEVEADLVEIPDDEVLFQKQYYSISEVAGWFKVNTSLLRFWENEFDILKPRKNRKGDRLFRPEDVKNLQLIYQLLRHKKYSIEGAKEFLKHNKQKADTHMQLVNTLQKFRSFLLELKAGL